MPTGCPWAFATRPARPGALVLLVETIGESANLRSIPQYGYLESVALRARMEFEQVFISRTQYSRIENGDVLPNAAELIALHAILDVPFDWLLLGEKGEP